MTEEHSGPSKTTMADSESSGTDDTAGLGCPLADLRAALMNGSDQVLSEDSGSGSVEMKIIKTSESTEIIDDEDSELNEIFGHADSSTDVPPGTDTQSMEVPTSPEDSLTGATLASVTATAKAEEFEYQDQLDIIIRDIHNYLGCLV